MTKLACYNVISKYLQRCRARPFYFMKTNWFVDSPAACQPTLQERIAPKRGPMEAGAVKQNQAVSLYLFFFLNTFLGVWLSTGNGNLQCCRLLIKLFVNFRHWRLSNSRRFARTTFNAVDTEGILDGAWAVKR